MFDLVHSADGTSDWMDQEPRKRAAEVDVAIVSWALRLFGHGDSDSNHILIQESPTGLIPLHSPLSI